MSSNDAIGYYWDFASYETGEAQAYAEEAISYPATQTFEQIDYSMGAAGNWLAEYKEAAAIEYEKAQQEAITALEEDEWAAKEPPDWIEEFIERILGGARDEINIMINEADSDVWRFILQIVDSILAGFEAIIRTILEVIQWLIDAITEVAETLANFFGDVFEVMLEHIIDYGGEKMTGFIINALELEVGE